MLRQIADVYKFSASDSLNCYILDCFDKVNTPGTEQAEFCGSIMEKHVVDNGDILKAVQYGLRAFKILQNLPKENTEEKAGILYTLGAVYGLIDLNIALKFFNDALAFAPGDQNIIIDLYYTHLGLDNFSQANEVASTIQDLEFRLLAETYVQIMMNQGMPEAISKFIDELETSFSLDTLASMKTGIDDKSKIYTDILIEKNKSIGNITGVIELFKIKIELSYNDNHFMAMYLKVNSALQVLQKHEKWEEGYEFLNNMYAKYPILKTHNYAPLKHSEYIFYMDSPDHSGKAEAIVKFFHEQALKSFQNVKWPALSVYELAINKALTTDNISKLSHYLQCLSELPEDNYKVQSLKWLIQNYFECAQALKAAAISIEAASDEKASEEKPTERPQKQLAASPGQAGDPEKGGVVVQQPLTKAQRITFADIQLMIETGDYETLSIVPHGILNKYYQHNKNELKKQKYQDEKNKNANSIFSWNIGTEIYTSSQEEIIQCGDSKFYATISEKLTHSLDKVTLSQFTTALSNGIISRDHGQCGIKFIPNKLIELKIMADLRLYTTTIWQNPEGAYLIFFNKQAGHTEIEKIAPKSKISLIILEDKSESSQIEVAGDFEYTEYYSYPDNHTELSGCDGSSD